MTRLVYGYAYELILAGQAEGEHSYVGKCVRPTTIHQRVHGKSSSAHTSPESVAKDPWKARILPGRAGYRQLEVVYDTGDPAENDRALRRAEAFWIDRLKTVHNDVRPVRPAGAPARRPQSAATRRRSPARRPVRHRPKFKPLALFALIVLFTYLTARVVTAMALPWPQAPWIASPMAGLALGWVTFWRIHRSIRRVFR